MKMEKTAIRQKRCIMHSETLAGPFKALCHHSLAQITNFIIFSWRCNFINYPSIILQLRNAIHFASHSLKPWNQLQNYTLCSCIVQPRTIWWCHLPHLLCHIVVHQRQHPVLNRMRTLWLQFNFCVHSSQRCLASVSSTARFFFSCDLVHKNYYWEMKKKKTEWGRAKQKSIFHCENDKLHVWVMISKTIWHIIRQGARAQFLDYSTRMNEYVACTRVFLFLRCDMSRTKRVAVALVCSAFSSQHFQFRTISLCFAFLVSAFSRISIHLHHGLRINLFQRENDFIRANRIRFARPAQSQNDFHFRSTPSHNKKRHAKIIN